MQHLFLVNMGMYCMCHGANCSSGDFQSRNLCICTSHVSRSKHCPITHDVRIFNPHAPTNKSTISKCYWKHEPEKKRAYEQHILEVEQLTFTPLIFSATGGMGKQSTSFYIQEAGLTPCWQVWTPLQLNTLLAKMTPVVLPPEICHPVYQRWMLLLRPCF